eukprot:scaffold190317_cov30-Tisochrysis_lutea.AAC.4
MTVTASRPIRARRACYTASQADAGAHLARVSLVGSSVLPPFLTLPHVPGQVLGGLGRATRASVALPCTHRVAGRGWRRWPSA